MLDILSSILEPLFRYGFPTLVIAWAIVLLILASISLFTLSEPSDRWKKIESASFALGQLCCVKWFFGMLSDFGPQEAGQTHIPATIAMGVMLFLAAVPNALKKGGLPYLLSAIVYVGIVVFGV